MHRDKALLRTIKFGGSMAAIRDATIIGAALPKLDLTKYGLADYSFYDGIVNWVKAKASGMNRPIIRVGQGYTGLDTQLVANANGSKGLWPTRDFYWVLDSRVSANGQARTCMEALQKYGNMDSDSILWADFELPGLSADFLWGFLQTCKSINPSLQLGIYTGYSFWQTNGSADVKYTFQQFKLWIAWPVSPYIEPKPLAPWGNNWYYHQWTFVGDGAYYGAQSAGIDLSYRNPSISPPPPPPVTHELRESQLLFDGARYSRYVAHYQRGDITYHVLEIEAAKAQFEVSPWTNSVKYVPSSLVNNKYDLAINGDGWKYVSGVGIVMAGLEASNGNVYGVTGQEETIYISKDSKFSTTRPATIWNALSVPNVLIQDGVRRAVVATRLDTDPRTACGWTKDGSKFIMLCVDGVETYDLRRTGMNYPEVCEVLEMHGVWDGFMNDGGGSSTMVANDAGTPKILNVPCGEDTVAAYGNARLRAVANVLGVRMKQTIPPPPPPEGNKMYRIIKAVKPRKSPSMFEPITLAEIVVGYEFTSPSVPVIKQETINGVVYTLTFIQLPNAYWVPMALPYNNSTYVEAFIPTVTDGVVVNSVDITTSPDGLTLTKTVKYTVTSGGIVQPQVTVVETYKKQ